MGIEAFNVSKGIKKVYVVPLSSTVTVLFTILLCNSPLLVPPMSTLCLGNYLISIILSRERIFNYQSVVKYSQTVLHNPHNFFFSCCAFSLFVNILLNTPRHFIIVFTTKVSINFLLAWLITGRATEAFLILLMLTRITFNVWALHPIKGR